MSCSSRFAAPSSVRAQGCHRRAALLLAVVATVWPIMLLAQPHPPPEEVATDLPGARLQGRGRLTYFGLRVYDIRLWSATPLRSNDVEHGPLALEIEYERSLQGRMIAERSIAEMRRLDKVSSADGDRWLAAMTSLFPDVRAGDRITGTHRPGTSARFHVNGRFVGEVRDPDFARLFFGIWLSPRSSEPALREALLGGAS